MLNSCADFRSHYNNSLPASPGQEFYIILKNEGNFKKLILNILAGTTGQ
jgi:hypothetical protein